MLAVLLFVLFANAGTAPRKQAKLGVMTSLPLLWGEGDVGEIIQQGSKPLAAYERLDARYDVRMIDSLNAKNLKSVHMLLLAQSRALAPAEFVALDNWVRKGGHLIILADPALQWESRYPLGDKRRPLFTSLLSPLFKHWGLELTLPIGDDESGVIIRKIGNYSIRTVTRGSWQRAKQTGQAECRIAESEIVAECKVGKGTALLIADSDLLHEDFWTGSGARMITGSDDFDNMNWIEANLNRLWYHESG